MAHTTVSTIRVSSLAPEQSGENRFEVPSRLETSMGVLSVSTLVAAGTTVDLSNLLIEHGGSALDPKEKEVGLISLQSDNSFDVSLFNDGEADVFSGIEGTLYIKAIDGNVHHVKVKAGAADVSLSGLITTGFLS